MGLKQSRRPGESLHIGDVVIKIEQIVGSGLRPKVVFDITTPPGVKVERPEWLAKQEANK